MKITNHKNICNYKNDLVEIKFWSDFKNEISEPFTPNERIFNDHLSLVEKILGRRARNIGGVHNILQNFKHLF
jgi:hypothetical protein